jgi:hypothetical protein
LFAFNIVSTPFDFITISFVCGSCSAKPAPNAPILLQFYRQAEFEPWGAGPSLLVQFQGLSGAYMFNCIGVKRSMLCHRSKFGQSDMLRKARLKVFVRPSQLPTRQSAAWQRELTL